MEIESLVKLISHDLRGPLSNMKSVTTLFETGDVQMDQAKMFMQHIEMGVDRSLVLLDELVAWGIASSECKIKTNEEINLIEIVQETKNTLQEYIESKNTNVIIHPSTEVQATFNKNALGVILKNLISNAIRFTAKEGTIEVKVEEVDNHYELSVLDTGIGVPEEMRETLFRMSKDNRRLGTEEEKGAGIGLFICEDLSTKNDQRVWFEPRVDQDGSVFKLSLAKYQS